MLGYVAIKRNNAELFAIKSSILDILTKNELRKAKY